MALKFVLEYFLKPCIFLSIKLVYLKFVIQAKAFDKSFKKVKRVSITIVSSNINDIIRAILDFFIQKFHKHKKAQKAYKRTKIKNAPKKHLRGK